MHGVRSAAERWARHIACVALFAAAAMPAAAQVAATPWELAGSVGATFRSERGRTIGGGRLEAALRRPGTPTTLAGGAAFAQVVARHGAQGDSGNVKENSVEIFALAERRLAMRGRWRLTGALGPALAFAAGCSTGGYFANDTYGYGDVPCANHFAEGGTVRLGAIAEIMNELRPGRSAFVFGVRATAHTVAAGDAVALTALIGFRAPLR